MRGGALWLCGFDRWLGLGRERKESYAGWMGGAELYTYEVLFKVNLLYRRWFSCGFHVMDLNFVLAGLGGIMRWLGILG